MTKKGGRRGKRRKKGAAAAAEAAEKENEQPGAVDGAGGSKRASPVPADLTEVCTAWEPPCTTTVISGWYLVSV